MPAAALEAVRTARTEVAQRLERLKQDYPPVGRLALTGHAHIDLAWLWPVAETRRKGRRTFATVLDLMERYPDFTFNQSSAQLYAWIEEDAPDLFARVKERVAEGRWEPIGGSWVEPDSQITGGESFVRQLLYGQRAFEAWFGKRSTVAWLPDVFGFSGGIPQLLRGAGIDGFFTTKLNWNEENLFPYDLFTWEGIDGSRVTANMFRNLSPPMATTATSPRSTPSARGATSGASASTRRACSPSAGVTAAAGHRHACSRTTRASGSSRRCRACAWRTSRSISPRCRNRVCRSGWVSSTWSSTAAR